MLMGTLTWKWPTSEPAEIGYNPMLNEFRPIDSISVSESIHSNKFLLIPSYQECAGVTVTPDFEADRISVQPMSLLPRCTSERISKRQQEKRETRDEDEGQNKQ